MKIQENLWNKISFNKNVVKFAKGCFAQLKELTEKYNEQLEVNEMLRKQNSRLRESIDEQEKEIDGLYDDRKKLGYFKKFLKNIRCFCLTRFA